MNIRARVLAAGLVTAMLSAGATSPASEPAPAYVVELSGLHVYAPRSKGSDTVSLAYSVAVNGKELPVETVTLHNALAADADVAIAPDGARDGLPAVRFNAGPADTVIVRYAVVNAQGTGGGALAQKLLAQFVAGGGRPAQDYNDSIWPSALTPLTPASLFSANCDGAVAVDAYAIAGAQIARAIADEKGSFLVSKNYQGGDTSSGCGTQSNYDVVVRFGTTV